MTALPTSELWSRFRNKHCCWLYKSGGRSRILLADYKCTHCLNPCQRLLAFLKGSCQCWGSESRSPSKRPIFTLIVWIEDRENLGLSHKIDISISILIFQSSPRSNIASALHMATVVSSWSSSPVTQPTQPTAHCRPHSKHTAAHCVVW